MPLQGLAERILPARGAAQKASASFSEQLTDSPGRSDGESPNSPSPFREPASRTKVKYRYSATGKHLSSPLKGNSSSPDAKPTKSKRPNLTTFTPPLADKGKAPAVSRKRKASVCKEDVIPSGILSSPSPLTSAPTTPTVSTKDLPLPPSPRQPVSCLPKRLSSSKTLSLQVIGSATPKLSVFSQPLSPKRRQKKTKTNAQKDDDNWIIGNSVWVLVNQSGALVDNIAQNHNDLELSQPVMWWPAQVVQSQPLRVSLFGDFPSSSSSSRGLCTIFAPSSSNVQSINDDGGVKRFSCATFRTPSLSADGDRSPPTKKARLDDTASIEAKWESAVQSMDKASTLEKEGLPALLSSYAKTSGSFHDSLDDSDPDTSDLRQSVRKSASSAVKKSRPTGSTRKSKLQRLRANLKDGANPSVRRELSPCPPDPTLQIPGELILAMAPKTGGSYWPAKILSHVPARKEKYNVKFLDDEEYVISRDKFWTSEEEGFVRCTLGVWESAVKTIDDPESEDEDATEDGADDYANAEDPNNPTSKLPPPPPAEDFEDLSVRAQLAYVKPVLRAILKKEYAPAREKHDAFMKGGSGRVALMKSAGMRGGMDARFVKAVQKAICGWVLGNGGMKPERLDVEDILPGTSAQNEVGEAEGEAAIKVDSLEALPPENLPHDSMKDDQMEGMEGAAVSGDTTNAKDSITNEALPLSVPDKHFEAPQDSQMVIDGQEQQPVPLSLHTNDVGLNPAINQASLVHKSQLDLLAEVSQAVATEPSLLPSHPEVPKLNVDIPDITRKDTSCPPSPLTPVPDEDQHPQIPPRRTLPVVCEEFEILSGIEKLDYCLNILLPEAIQQLVLWRSGERTSAALLSPEEEQRLHDVGSRKGAETDWVDDLMRLRAAQARLWGVGLDKKVEEKVEVAEGGTRSRPRRGTVSRL